MEKIILKVNGMSCGHCVGKVERALKDLPGVELAKVDLKKGNAKVKYDASKVTIDDLNDAVREAGYESESTLKRWLI
jgi:copper chaperone